MDHDAPDVCNKFASRVTELTFAAKKRARQRNWLLGALADVGLSVYRFVPNVEVENKLRA